MPYFTLHTPPSLDVVTAALLRSHSRVDPAETDALLETYLRAAAASAERETGRSLLPQAWTATLDGFADELALAKPPITAITHVKYYDTAGSQVTLAVNTYRLVNDDLAARVVPVTRWPSPIATRPDAVEVRFATGYADVNAVPIEIRNWILVRAGTALDNRESVDKSGRLAKIDFFDSLLEHWWVPGGALAGV